MDSPQETDSPQDMDWAKGHENRPKENRPAENDAAPGDPTPLAGAADSAVENSAVGNSRNVESSQEVESEEASKGSSPTESAALELLADFAGGSDTALGKLLEGEKSWLLRRIRSRLPRGVERRVGGSDILQLTAMNVMSARERFENQGLPAFRRFVATVADRVLADELKRESAQKRNWERHVHRGVQTTAPGTDPLEQVAALQTSPSEVAMREEHLDLIKECFRKLNAHDRTIIRMIDYEQLGYEDTCQLLDISQDAARQRHHRAVSRLRALVEKEL